MVDGRAFGFGSADVLPATENRNGDVPNVARIAAVLSGSAKPVLILPDTERRMAPARPSRPAA